MSALTKSIRNKKRNDQFMMVSSSIPRTPYTAYSSNSPISPRLVTTLKYNERVTMALAVGPGFVTYDFRLNSLFDPNRTGTGHQPIGFDQLAALYLNYRVYACRYKVTLVVEASTQPATMLTVLPSNSGGAISNNETANELSNSKSTWSTYFAPATLEGRVDIAKINGKSRQAYESDDDTGAGVTTSPVNIAELWVVASNVTGLAQNAYADVTLWFESEFTNPQQLTQS